MKFNPALAWKGHCKARLLRPPDSDLSFSLESVRRCQGLYAHPASIAGVRSEVGSVLGRGLGAFRGTGRVAESRENPFRKTCETLISTRIFGFERWLPHRRSSQRSTLLRRGPRKSRRCVARGRRPPQCLGREFGCSSRLDWP